MLPAARTAAEVQRTHRVAAWDSDEEGTGPSQAAAPVAPAARMSRANILRDRCENRQTLSVTGKHSCRSVTVIDGHGS